MSTGAHERSIENQLHRIKAYAAQRNMEIIEIFTDAGVSTRSVKHRENRKRMIATVEAGKAAFKCILAYDVSRWGRLEAYDEAGYYESVCTRAGIAVHYCAEPPKNADITVSDMFESMRKFMAEKHRRKRPSKRSKTPVRVNSPTSRGAWSRA